MLLRSNKSILILEIEIRIKIKIIHSISVFNKIKIKYVVKGNNITVNQYSINYYFLLKTYNKNITLIINVTLKKSLVNKCYLNINIQIGKSIKIDSTKI